MKKFLVTFEIETDVLDEKMIRNEFTRCSPHYVQRDLDVVQQDEADDEPQPRLLVDIAAECNRVYDDAVRSLGDNLGGSLSDIEDAIIVSGIVKRANMRIKRQIALYRHDKIEREQAVTGVDNGPLVEDDGPWLHKSWREPDREQRDTSVTESQAARTKLSDSLAWRQNPQNPRNQR